MSRSLSIAIALALTTSTAFAQEAEATAEAELAEEEIYDEEIEYCGGGDISLVEELYEQMEWGSPADAYTTLVAALRNGEIERYERAGAIALLGELQLRLGQPGRAIVNFRRAEAFQAGVTEPYRMALATALYLRGERRKAAEEAHAIHDRTCATRYRETGCYGANQILARTAHTASERASAASDVVTIRAAHPDLAESFDALDGWLES